MGGCLKLAYSGFYKGIFGLINREVIYIIYVFRLGVH